MARCRLHPLALAVILLAPLPVTQPPVLGEEAGAAPDGGLFRELRWRCIGPFRGGRTVAATGVPASRTLLHRRQQRRACGRRPTTAGCGRRSSTTSRPARSARWPSPRRTRTSSTSAAARACSGPTCRPATACTSRPTAARRGRTSACATASRSRRSSSIRRTRTGCSSPCSAIRTGRTRSAASSARPTAGRDVGEGAVQGREHRAPSRRLRPERPEDVYAVLWAARQGPWENGAWQGPGSGLFKSTDGGTHLEAADEGSADLRRGPGSHRHRTWRRATRSGSSRWWTARGRAGSTAPTTRARPGAGQRRPALWRPRQTTSPR